MCSRRYDNINHPTSMQMIMKKLPVSMQNKWRDRVVIYLSTLTDHVIYDIPLMSAPAVLPCAPMGVLHDDVITARVTKMRRIDQDSRISRFGDLCRRMFRICKSSSIRQGRPWL